MSHTHDANCEHSEILTLHEIRTHLLTESFGADRVPAVQEILVRLAKVSYEACQSR